MAVLIVVCLGSIEMTVLGVLLTIFRHGPSGYFATHGRAVGWLILLAVEVLFTTLHLFEVPRIIPVILGWVIALIVFRLTVRQSIKLGVAQGLIYMALASTYAVVAH